jgi:hypothetical protein
VKYLVDANVWLDGITRGSHWQEVTEFFSRTPLGTLATTDFNVHAIGLILAPRAPDADE